MSFSTEHQPVSSRTTGLSSVSIQACSSPLGGPSQPATKLSGTAADASEQVGVVVDEDGGVESARDSSPALATTPYIRGAG